MPESVLTNIRVLKPSRRRLTPGDIFVVGLPDETYIFGRVIRVDIPEECAPTPRSNLIYIYRHRCRSKVPELAQLTPDRLLVPPLFTNRLGWSRGYFETVASQPLTPADLLPVHCFRTWTGAFVDDAGNRLPAERQPCGDFALWSFRGVDDQISKALGIPLVP
ncbi:hypothetical protein HC030_25010, partial [Planosporangium mesophilum]|nr:hypothetical protein [Planosporangium mesophilum]